MIVYKGLYPRILIGIGAGIAVDGHEVVSLDRIALLGLLLGGFIDIRGSGIIHLHPVLLQNLSYRQCQRQHVSLFLPALIDRTRIVPSVSGVDHHQCHRPNTCMPVSIILCGKHVFCSGALTFPDIVIQ